MATHFSILAWKILWTEEPGRLQSGGGGVGHKKQDATEHKNTATAIYKYFGRADEEKEWGYLLLVDRKRVSQVNADFHTYKVYYNFTQNTCHQLLGREMTPNSCNKIHIYFTCRTQNKVQSK